MKKVLALILALILAASMSVSAEIDLSGMSFEELVALQQEINNALWASDKWQEVSVPAGVYCIGVDIPAGKWNIAASPKVRKVDVTIGYLKEDGSFGYKYASDVIDLYGTEYYSYEEGKTSTAVFTLKEGDYIRIRDGAVIFTPFTGYSFSFK